MLRMQAVVGRVRALFEFKTGSPFRFIVNNTELII